MYQILGIVNIALLAVITSPYWLRRLNQWLHKPALSKLIKTMRVVHKPLGICLLLLSLVHGYLALGALRLHTGTVVGAMILITVVLGGTFYFRKKPALFAWHKRAALLVILLTVVHLVVPSAFYYIFG